MVAKQVMAAGYIGMITGGIAAYYAAHEGYVLAAVSIVLGLIYLRRVASVASLGRMIAAVLVLVACQPAHADCNAFFRKQVVYRQQYYAQAYVQQAYVQQVYVPLIYYAAGQDLQIQAAVKRELEYQQQMQAPSKGYQSPQQAPIQAPVQAPPKGSIEPLQNVEVGVFSKCIRCHSGAEPAGDLILDGKTGVTAHTYQRWGEIAILGKGVHPKMRALITAMTPEEKGSVNEALLHLIEDGLHRVDPLPEPLPPPPLPPRGDEGGLQ